MLPTARLVMDQVGAKTDDLGEQALGQTMLTHHRLGRVVAFLRQRNRTVRLDDHESVTLHTSHGLGDGRAGLVQSLDDTGAAQLDTLLEQLVESPQIHLRCIDELTAHGAPLPRPHSRGASLSTCPSDRLSDKTVGASLLMPERPPVRKFSAQIPVVVVRRTHRDG